VRPTDCFVTSWPRSGNTWMRYMLFNALYPGQPGGLLEINQVIPSIYHGLFRERLRALEPNPYRLFKTHEPFRPYFLAGKTVYIVRDGRDAILSFYDYRRHMDGLKLPFAAFVRRSLTRRFGYGPWQNHVKGWLAHRDHPNVLILTYERMLADPAAALRQTLAHFGITVADDVIEQAVGMASVDRVNHGFEELARSGGRQYSGGLGGGAGKGAAAFSEKEMSLFLARAGSVMQELGYPLTSESAERPAPPVLLKQGSDR